MSDNKEDPKPTENIISLHAKREKKTENEEKPKTEEEGYSFEEEAARNEKLKKQAEKRRQAVNKSVLRDYRIKN
jgi:small-conductance mechanosensitive channel